VIAFTATTPDRPPELYVMDTPDAKPRRLTNFNAWISQVALGKMERVTWRSDAFESDGVLLYPDPVRPGQHRSSADSAAPTSASAQLSALAQLMAAEG
jgi:dipeptidyl aminopeptidase/acylaminoacyl peptidase